MNGEGLKKGKVPESPGGEKRYSSTRRGEWPTPRPDRFNPSKQIRYQLYRKPGGT